MAHRLRGTFAVSEFSSGITPRGLRWPSYRILTDAGLAECDLGEAWKRVWRMPPIQLTQVLNILMEVQYTRCVAALFTVKTGTFLREQAYFQYDANLQSDGGQNHIESQFTHSKGFTCKVGAGIPRLLFAIVGAEFKFS